MDTVQFKDLRMNETIKLGGSTGAQVVTYKDTLYIYKTGISVKHAINEYIAFKVYKLADVRVPDVFLTYDDTKPVGILLEYIDGEIPMNIKGRTREETERIKSTIQRDYVVHALFANWDAKNYENYIVPKLSDGSYDYTNLYVIDLGGALLYRAQGEPKGKAFTKRNVPNIQTMAEYSVKTRAKYFMDLLDPELNFKTVCNRWKTIHRKRILDFLQSPAITSLLETYSMKSLVSIVTGRIDFMNVYCSGKKYSPNTVKHKKHKNHNVFPIPRKPKTYKKRWVTTQKPEL